MSRSKRQPDNNKRPHDNVAADQCHASPKLIPVEWKGQTANVPSYLAPLMIEIWKAKLVTLDTQRETPVGYIQIEFVTLPHARKFINTVVPYNTNPFCMYNRVQGYWQATDAERDVHGQWEFRLHPCNIAVQEHESDDGRVTEIATGPVDFRFSASITFPITDVPVIRDRMREFNGRRRKKSGE